MYSSLREIQYGEIFGGTIKEIIGRGSGGKTKVYLLVQKRNKEYFSALKVIPIIAEYRKKALCQDNYIKQYDEECARLCKEAEKEVQIMDVLKGCPNVVYYEEFQFRNWEEEDAFGCDLLIKMPRFNSVFELINNGCFFSEDEIIKIGKDICTALIHCHKINILHRDIKIENIFRNEQKVYLLGDFGISRILDRAQMASTSIGTSQYAAPEQMRLEQYDQRVDIYSLGLVLYVLGNENRFPFANKYNIAWDSREIIRRLSGERIPPPQGCGNELANVILKACSFRKEDRYQNAEEFLAALTKVCPVGNVEGGVDRSCIHRNAFQLDRYETEPAKPEEEFQLEESNDLFQNEYLKSNQDRKCLDFSQVAQLASEGDAVAQYLLAECYHDGIDVTKDDNKAVAWYRKAVAQNNAEAQFGLGVCYIHGQGVRKDVIEAVKLFRKAAGQGYYPAAYYLGECYFSGYHGITIDHNEAVKWFRKAAEKGAAMAQVRLGDCYLGGYGVEKNRNKAQIWYEAAAGQGESSAQERLNQLRDKLR